MCTIFFISPFATNSTPTKIESQPTADFDQHMVFAGSVFRSRHFTAKDFYVLLNFTLTPISHVTYQYKVYSWNISLIALRGLLETSGMPAYISYE